MSFVTPNQLDAIQTVALALPQTELRRQRSVLAAVLALRLGQVLELRALNLHLVQILTPAVTPELVTSGVGLVTAGLYLGDSMTPGGIGLVAATTPQVASLNAAQPVRVTAPGVYKVFVTNNSNNVDVSVVLTGSCRIS